MVGRVRRKKKSGGGLSIKIKPFSKPPSLPENFYKSSTDILWSSLRSILLRSSKLATSSAAVNANANVNVNVNASANAPSSPKTSAGDPMGDSDGKAALDNVNVSANLNVPSREELYNTVQNLCTHGFGPELYEELITVLDESAFICVQRLLEGDANANVNNNANANAGGHDDDIAAVSCSGTDFQLSPGASTYATRNCQIDGGNGHDPDYSNEYSHSHPQIFFTSVDEESPASDGSIILTNVWKMYSDYAQFLNCVRAVFMALDRMFIYLPNPNPCTRTSASTNTSNISRTQKEGRVISRNATSDIKFGGEGGGNASAIFTTGVDAWDMWDVGMNCLWRHLALKKRSASTSSSAYAASRAGDTGMNTASMDYSSSPQCGGERDGNDNGNRNGNGKYSIIDALKMRTIKCILAELDLLQSRSPHTMQQHSFQQSHDADMRGIGSGGNTELLHKSLVRNCVSIFRTLAYVSGNGNDTGSGKGGDGMYNSDGNSSSDNGDTSSGTRSSKSNANSNINKEFLNDLVKAMTDYLKHESQQWMSEADTSSAAPSKTSYDACSLLHHIDNRTKQVSGMTSYYHLVNDFPSNGSSSSGGSGDRGGSGNGSDSSKSKTTKKGPNNILTHLVEKYILTPHFTPQLILHPTNLYPILDQEKKTQNQDAKLVFKLSKRIVATSSSTTLAMTNISRGTNTISNFPGMELLRQSFESYGMERGLAIMRTASAPNIIGNVGTKPTSQPLTAREVNTKIIMNLLNYKAHVEYLHKEAFDGENFFGRTLRKVLEDILNNGSPEEEMTLANNPGRRNRYANNSSDGGKRVAELLAKYMDLRFKNAKSSLASTLNMKTPSSGSADSDLEIFQAAALDLFRYIQSKDVFEAFYRQDLAKRLLLNKSSSIDAERSFVSKLKAECGTGYTTKMEGMFKDMELSKDVMSTYTAYLSANANANANTLTATKSGKLDMEVQVLTTGYWPVRTMKYDIILPQSMLDKKAEFEQYYKTKYQGRRIAWQNALGNCIVRAYFPKISGPRELNVSLLQALVLFSFNLDGDNGIDVRLTLGEIMKLTGISDRGEAERVLQSLSMGRTGTQVLQRIDGDKVHSASSSTMDIDNNNSTPRKKHKTNRKAISDSDIFVFNANFTSNQRRIRITNIQMKETSDDRKKTHEAVTLDRLHLIDAAIVRIMKARKTLEHRDLVGEVMNQLKFPARSVDLKKRIESLIDREYLERAEGTVSKYNYLA